jgi:hypothetical protein
MTPYLFLLTSITWFVLLGYALDQLGRTYEVD